MATDQASALIRALVAKRQQPSSPAGARALVRRIIEPNLDDNGLSIQPPDVGAIREEFEKLRREFWSNHFAYSDPWIGRSRTYDPTGKYNCGRCNMVDAIRCLLLKIPAINPVGGSCSHWEDQCAGDAEMPVNAIPPEGAAYAETGPDGWGCVRCWWAEPAVAPDSMGRTLYCRRADCRVLETACCAINSADQSSFEAAVESLGSS